jgi:broad specificity phosphatase PhoE
MTIPSIHSGREMRPHPAAASSAVPAPRVQREELTITLIRHGQPALELPSNRITAHEFREWIEEYNRTGLAAGSFPPETLVMALMNVPLIVCSDSPRALESAKRVGPRANLRITPLFREAGRPLGGHWKVKLPHSAWDYLSGSLWHKGLIAGTESKRSARRRARQAAEELVRLAEEKGWVACVAHATFNSLVGPELRKLGWKGPNRPRAEFWAGGTYSKENVDAAK